MGTAPHGCRPPLPSRLLLVVDRDLPHFGALGRGAGGVGQRLPCLATEVAARVDAFLALPEGNAESLAALAVDEQREADESPRVVAGRSTAIEVTLAADYGTDLVALGEQIRAEVTDRVRDLTGLEPVVVTVRIEDVFE